LRNGKGFPATLKMPISPRSKLRKLVDLPEPLKPRIKQLTPI
jgi:hypothetical protein